MTVLLLFLLIPWCVLSVALQVMLIRNIKRRRPQIFPGWIKWDVFHLLTAWVVFASPPLSDNLVFYRDRDCDGFHTRWTLITFPRPNRFVQWLWNPHHQRSKALEDYVNGLKEVLFAHIQDTSTNVVDCIPYCGLAAYVDGLNKSPLSASRQFVIAETRGQQELTLDRIVFVSAELAPDRQGVRLEQAPIAGQYCQNIFDAAPAKVCNSRLLPW
jgi:hypothetical protein